MTQQEAYILDMSQTLEDGSFFCPHCRIKISPDDHSESNYIVSETKMRGNSLCEVIISCQRCLSHIHLVVDDEIGQLANVEESVLFFGHI